MAELDPQIFETLRQYLPEGLSLAIPPPVFLELGGRFTEYGESKTLKAVYPALQKFTNPMGSVQGGVVGAALDANYGSLAFIATRIPHVTVTMDTTFIRPILADNRDYIVEVRIRAQTRTLLFMDGEVYTQDGKLAATSTTTMAALRPRV